MTIDKAKNILQEMQKWRRGEKPYDGDAPEEMPYSPKEFGKAIDVAIEQMNMPVSVELINRIISLHTEYRYGSMLRTESEEDFIINSLTVN